MRRCGTAGSCYCAAALRLRKHLPTVIPSSRAHAGDINAPETALTFGAVLLLAHDFNAKYAGRATAEVIPEDRIFPAADDTGDMKCDFTVSVAARQGRIVCV